MRKIINGKVYNTDTAIKISSYWNGLGNGDFNNLAEALYKSPKGTYFLAGSGGAKSKYSQSAGQNTWREGSGIYILDEIEAREWLERHGSSEEYEKEFTVEEG